MPVSYFHRQVATFALTAAAEHGFVLGGASGRTAAPTVTATAEMVSRAPVVSGSLMQPRIPAARSASPAG